MTVSACPRCQGPMSGSDQEAYCPRCAGRLLLGTEGTSADADDASRRAGILRLGDYELGPELGRGAMGVVYRARQPRLKRDVAVKVILASRFAGEAARKRFLAEAELAAQLDHPNIVPIYEVGETPAGPFYVMKLVEGGTLAEKLLRSNPHEEAHFESRIQSEPPHVVCYQIKGAATLVAQVARAVHHAHQRGVLHRDLKPGNILIDPQGEPHVTDFGLARQMDAESSLTASGTVLGTPAYMSPEQARGEKGVTTASDVWSLGAIFYHLLAGRPPFIGDSAVAVMRKAMEEEPVAPSRVKSEIRSPSSERSPKPEIRNDSDADFRIRRSDFGFLSAFGFRPSDLDTICLKCLEKDPARRYASALALAEDLERWLNHEPIRARPTSSGERLVKWARRNPARATLATALLVMSLVAITGITWQWRRAERNAKAERASSQQAREQLWSSLLGQARAGRLSGQFGSKRAGLEAIAAAARIRPSPELRDEAIAHLALFDLQPDSHAHRQTNYLRYPCFDADGTLGADMDIATGTLRVFRTSDDVEVARWFLPRGSASTRFSSLGRHLFVMRGDELIVVDARTGKERFRLRNVRRARFSPDDTMLAVVGTDQIVRFVDADTGKSHPHQFTLASREEDLVWSPDGEVLALATGDKVEIWDWRNGKSIQRLQHDAYILRVAWQRECLAIGDERGGIQLALEQPHKKVPPTAWP